MESSPASPSMGRSLSKTVSPLRNQFQVACGILDAGVLDIKKISDTFNALISPEAQINALTSPEIILESAIRTYAQLVLIIAIADNEHHSPTESLGEKLLNSIPSIRGIANQIEQDAKDRAESLLESLANNKLTKHLLPYIFDTHGDTTRLDVIRDSTKAQSRNTRKKNGVFYTPKDVADYLTKYILNNTNPHPLILDPACGSGVFARSLCRARDSASKINNLQFILESIHGLDIDLRAVSSAISVCLHECLIDQSVDLRNMEKGYRSISQKFRNVDTTLINTNHSESTDLLNIYKENSSCLSEIFPASQNGFDAIIGNPPFANCPEDGCQSIRADLFSTYRSNSKRHPMPPIFVELAHRLLKKEGKVACAYVLPLSIAFSQESHYKQARELIYNSVLTWDFTSFDRQPHGLFGEEVKVRISLLTGCLNLANERKNIGTTHIKKFRSSERHLLFPDTIPTHKISAPRHLNFLPKIESETEEELLNLIVAIPSKFNTYESHSTLENIPLYIGGTAYNFINSFILKHTAKDTYNGMDIRVPKICIFVNTLELAYAHYAILASRFTFWLWHVTGDGFHVSKSLINMIPFNTILSTRSNQKALSVAGLALWNEVSKTPKFHKNGGTTTISFDPRTLSSQRSKIDSIILNALQYAPPKGGDFLHQFENKITLKQ